MVFMEKAHHQSIYGHIEMNRATIQRNFVVAMQFDDGYAKVLEKDGKVIGGLVGLIGDNSCGIRSAQDLFTYSNGGTTILIKDFLQWAEVRGARFVQVTDLSHNPRYEKLCRAMGLNPAGNNYAKVM